MAVKKVIRKEGLQKITQTRNQISILGGGRRQKGCACEWKNKLAVKKVIRKRRITEHYINYRSNIT